MIFPSLADVFAFLRAFPLEYSTLIFFLTGSLILLVRDWRVSVAALVVQYLALGAGLVHVVRPEIAAAKVLVGLFIGLMLYLSARQAGWRHRLTISAHGIKALMGTRLVGGEVFPPGRVFRLLVTLLLMVTAVSLAQTYPIGELPGAAAIGVYWLVLVGATVLTLSENPLKVGQGLLTAITGFELWYTTLEGSLLMVWLWGAVNLLLALAVGYLAIIRSGETEEDF